MICEKINSVRRGRSVLCMIASYFFFVLLIMPYRMIGLIQTAVLLPLGTLLILWRRPAPPMKKPEKWPLAVSVCILAVMGLCFHGRWLYAPQIQAIASVLRLPMPVLVPVTAVAMALFAGYGIFYCVQKLYGVLMATGEKAAVRRDLCVCVLMACMSVVLSQVMSEADIFSMGVYQLAWNVLLVSVVNVFWYMLLGKPFAAAVVGAVPFMLLSVVNAYVHRFRGRPFEPVDIFSVGTALNVADNYSLLPIPSGVLQGLGLWLAALVGLRLVIPKKRCALTRKGKGLLALGCTVAAVAVVCYCVVLKPYHWEKQGAQYNGYILDFAAKIKEAVVLPPDGYSPEAVEQLQERYAHDAGEVKRKPHVIVIMDEAFSDLSVHGPLHTDADVMPFIASLEENTVRGYTLASIYGGNTANSEFEFLTGNTMAWLSENAVPYQQYIRSDAYSMVSYLKGSYGYRCIAMHPYLSSGWNRPAVYGHLGFDEMRFLEDFPQKDLIRGYVSDREMFESVIAAFEACREQPMFLFGVTMQNHGGYTYTGADFKTTVTLTQGLYDPQVEQYLSLLRETDRAVEYLIQYFSSVEEEVVILFFGDHQPKLSENFFRALGNGEQTLQERQQRYTVPFFLWANYDIPEQKDILTSMNFLSNFVYEAAGIDLPPYNRFLAEMAVCVPAINSQGFYSNASGCYLPFDEASAAERQWLADYRILQYNSLWAGEGRNEIFFPIS